MTLPRLPTDGGRLGLFIAAALTLAAAIGLADPTTDNAPAGAVLLLGISLLLVLFSIERPPDRTE